MPEERKSLREQADDCRAKLEAAKADKRNAPRNADRKALNQRI